jgi:hypothetical protein
LPPAEQQRVLDYAQEREQSIPTVSTSVNGTPMSNLLRFAGALPSDVVDSMTEAIQDCERIETEDDNLSF